jgi:hypothetical protein
MNKAQRRRIRRADKPVKVPRPDHGGGDPRSSPGLQTLPWIGHRP